MTGALRSMAALAGLAALLSLTGPAHAQGASRHQGVIFDAVTLDDAQIVLNRAQSRQVARIASLARSGNDDAAIQEWESFVKRHYRPDSTLNLRALELLIVRDAYFYDRELLDIGLRYRQSTRSTARREAGAGDAVNYDPTARKLEDLRKEQSNTAMDREMAMTQLRAAMQSRSQTVLAASNLLAAIHDSTKTIVGNIR